jgi:hypothetical protein
MTLQKEGQDRFGMARFILPIALCVVTSAVGFAFGVERCQSEQQTQLQDIRADIEKIRSMPDPSQVVTKDQLTEIVRRLDERTEQIGQDVQYLRQREERRQ